MSKKAAPGLDDGNSDPDPTVDDRDVDELPPMLDDDDLEVPDDWAKPASESYASADALLDSTEATRETQDVWLPSAKQWVKIHELTRADAIKISDTKSGTDRERKSICWGLAEPAMTYQQVEAWHRKAGAGDVQVLVESITELSGMVEDSRKRAYKRFRGQTG